MSEHIFCLEPETPLRELFNLRIEKKPSIISLCERPAEIGADETIHSRILLLGIELHVNGSDTATYDLFITLTCTCNLPHVLANFVFWTSLMHNAINVIFKNITIKYLQQWRHCPSTFTHGTYRHGWLTGTLPLGLLILSAASQYSPPLLTRVFRL